MKQIFLAAISSCFLSLGPASGANIEALPTKVQQSQPAATSDFPTLKGHAEVNVDFAIDPQLTGLPIADDNQTLVNGAGESPQLVVDNDLSFEWAFRRSEWIAVCEYRGIEKQESNGLINHSQAIYHVVKRLKGPPSAKDLLIKHQSGEGAVKSTSGGWQSDNDKMPAIGSQWIIFIPVFIAGPDKCFHTYKDAYGLQEATDSNLGTLYAIIEAHHGQTGGDFPISRGSGTHTQPQTDLLHRAVSPPISPDGSLQEVSSWFR